MTVPGIPGGAATVARLRAGGGLRAQDPYRVDVPGVVLLDPDSRRFLWSVAVVRLGAFTGCCIPGLAVRGFLHSLGYVDRLRETVQGASAARDQARCLLPALVREEVPGLDLRQPARQFLQILLALLHFGERVLLRFGFLTDFLEQGRAALGELVVLPGPVGPEKLHDRFSGLRRQARDVQYESRPALPDNVLPQLLKELSVRNRVRQQPGAIYHRGR